MDDFVIRVERLWKQYRIGAADQARTFRELLERAARWPVRFCRRPEAAPVFFWALKDVSFEVRRGEVLGIVGRNGAGKSTLLKVLSRITEPTRGRVEIQGRVGSLLEVGTGFHPELTGRENTFLNGSILGLKRAEIAAKFDEIVAFAEVERFLDTPVKHYSSGMYLRLAFAVAAHLEPEILIVDEVLAVGDAQFQKKCIAKMEAVAQQGRTVLFVSHNLAAVQKLCPRAMLLREGELDRDGAVNGVIRDYLGAGREATGRLDARGRLGRPTDAVIRDAWLERDGVATSTLLFGDRAELFVEIEILRPALFSVELILRQGDGLPVAFAPSGFAQDADVWANQGRMKVRAGLPPARLAKGSYSIDILLAETNVRFLDQIESAVSFQVDSCAIGKRNWEFSQSRGQGHQLWEVEFNFPSVARAAVN